MRAAIEHTSLHCRSSLPTAEPRSPRSDPLAPVCIGASSAASAPAPQTETPSPTPSAGGSRGRSERRPGSADTIGRCSPGTIPCVTAGRGTSRRAPLRCHPGPASACGETRSGNRRPTPPVVHGAGQPARLSATPRAAGTPWCWGAFPPRDGRSPAPANRQYHRDEVIGCSRIWLINFVHGWIEAMA